MGRENVVWSRSGHADAVAAWATRTPPGLDVLRAWADGTLEQQLDAFCGAVEAVRSGADDPDAVLSLALGILDARRVDWRKSRLVGLRIDLLEAGAHGLQARGRPFGAAWLGLIAEGIGGTPPDPTLLASALSVATASPTAPEHTSDGLVARGRLLEALDAARRDGAHGFPQALCAAALAGDVEPLQAPSLESGPLALAHLFAHALPERRAAHRLPELGPGWDPLVDALAAPDEGAAVEERLLRLTRPLELAVTGPDAARGLLGVGAVLRFAHQARRPAVVRFLLALLHDWSLRVSEGCSRDVYRTATDIVETVDLPVLAESSWARTARTLTLLTELGAAFGAARVRQLFRSTHRAKRLTDDEREALGRVFVRHARRMKGPLMKVAQHMGYGGVPLSPRVARQLAALCDRSPAMPFDRVQEVLTEELGDPRRVFASIEPMPLGTGSVGQVHGARLHDGRHVAVKVLYPGIRDAIAHDVRLLGMSTPLLRILVPRTPWGDVVDELEAELLRETDLHREAGLQRAFADGFADDPHVRVPRPVDELVTERVLVMDRAVGERLEPFAARADQAARQRATDALYRFFLRDIGANALYADFNPGNVLFADDAVWCLDFGCVKRWDDAMHAKIRAFVTGAVLRDPARFRPAARALDVTSDPDHFDYDRLLALFDPETYRRTDGDGRPLPFAPHDVFRLVAGFRLRTDQTLQPYHLFGIRAYFSFIALVVHLGCSDTGMEVARSVIERAEAGSSSRDAREAPVPTEATR